MNVQQLVDKWCEKMLVDRCDVAEVPAVAYRGDGGSVSAEHSMADWFAEDTGRYRLGVIREIVYGEKRDDCRAIPCTGNEGATVAAPVWEGQGQGAMCVGFMAYDGDGMHFAQPAVLANSGGLDHPLARAFGVAERMDA